MANERNRFAWSRRYGWAAEVALAIAALLPAVAPGRAEVCRVATFNVALYGDRPGALRERLKRRDDPQLQRIAEIIQRAAPEALLLNEFDFDPQGEHLRLFCENYLQRPQNASHSPAGPADAIEFPYRLPFRSNTGEPSGVDLDADGRVDDSPGDDSYAADCWGYGKYPGQYAFALLSQRPIDEKGVRTFRTFRWRDLPAANFPDDPATAATGDWHPPRVKELLRLSSKNHCDVPVRIAERTIHFLLSHPTPPVFDGAEDRNGCRNRDELRFWKLYIESPSSSTDDRPAPFAPIDDDGVAGPLAAGASFLLLGDLNGDPLDGEGPQGIAALLASPPVGAGRTPPQRRRRGTSPLSGGANHRHRGDSACDTCDPPDEPGPGNLRLDYVLPSNDLRVVASGVFWPTGDDPLAALTGGAAEPASSDHRLVWVDIELGSSPPVPE